MVFQKEQLVLYAITDSSNLHGKSLSDQVQQAISGGITMLQYREKMKPYGEKKKEAVELLQICRNNHIPFIINDDVELALEIGADGVHVGQSDMAAEKARQVLGSNAIVGVTAKTVEQAKMAQNAGATYLGSGALFQTSTKQDAKPMTKEMFTDIVNVVDIPVVGIGGITEEKVHLLKELPLSGIAVVNAIFGQEDVAEATKNLKSMINEILN